MKQVYTFGNGQAEGRADMKNLLGGKGANLAEMNHIGVPVPPGFTITTEICTAYNKNGKEAVVKMLKDDVEKAIAHVEKLMGTEIRRRRKSAVSLRSFGSTRLNAGYDGHRSQFGYERRCRRGNRPEIRQSTFCMGFLPAFRTDVRRCRFRP